VITTNDLFEIVIVLVSRRFVRTMTWACLVRHTSRRRGLAKMFKKSLVKNFTIWEIHFGSSFPRGVELSRILSFWFPIFFGS
jgi:hypothetical protein